MRAGNKQYGAATAAASNTPQTSKQVAPNNESRRLLFIQNTGANPGLLQFTNPVKGDGSDILFAAGAGLLWDKPETCPTEAVNLGSALATTWAIVEGNG